jgi:hypothetical protein
MRHGLEESVIFNGPGDVDWLRSFRHCVGHAGPDILTGCCIGDWVIPKLANGTSCRALHTYRRYGDKLTRCKFW